MDKLQSKHNLKTSNGFTLIEVLVSVALIGVLITMVTTIFINTVRNAKKADIVNEARQNAGLVIDQLQRDVRSASGAGVSFSGKQLNLTYPSSAPGVIWLCNAPTATTNGYITRNGTTITNRDPVSGVNILNSECNFTPNLASTSIVTFNFTLHEGVSVQTAAQEYNVTLPFTTSVVIRGY